MEEHSFAHNLTFACLHVGRVGALAVALGVGTAAVAGISAASAYADTGDSAGSATGSEEKSTSPFANPAVRGPARTDKGSVGSARNPGRRADSEVALPAAADWGSPASSPGFSVGDEIDLAVPAAGTESSPDATADLPDSPAVRFGAARTAPPMPQLEPVAVIASPPAASIYPATANTVLASLSTAMSVNTPTPAVDTALAILLGTTRREGDIAVRGSGLATQQTIAPAAATSSTTSSTTGVEAERMTVSTAGAGIVVTDRTASGKSALALVKNGTASVTVTVPAATGLVVRAKASLNAGAPSMTLSIDGVPVATIMVKSTKWSDYTFAGAIPAGTHELSITYSNNYDTATGTRDLFIDKITTVTGTIGDEFSGSAGSAPNSSVWTVKTGSGWTPGIENYTTNNAFLDGYGNLVLQAVKTSSGGYTSGWVESTNKMSFGYGTTTARIKVPKGQGLWPAFWLKGADEDTTAWPHSGEIDVMELPSTTTTMYSTLHGPIAGTTATQQAQVISKLPDLSNGYHNYWVRHLENQITFGVDNITLGTLTPESLPSGATWVYNRPQQVILNLAVGGPWAGAPDSTTPSQASMTVDWVRWEPA